jgi:hypothetical protein
MEEDHYLPAFCLFSNRACKPPEVREEERKERLKGGVVLDKKERRKKTKTKET